MVSDKNAIGGQDEETIMADLSLPNIANSLMRMVNLHYIVCLMERERPR